MVVDHHVIELYHYQAQKYQTGKTEKDRRLLRGIRYTVYPIIKQKFCERDLSREWICMKTLL